MSGTHTYAVMHVSKSSYEEVKRLLLAADYTHAIDEDCLDMHGLALGIDDNLNTPLDAHPTKRIADHVGFEGCNAYITDCLQDGMDSKYAAEVEFTVSEAARRGFFEKELTNYLERNNLKIVENT